MVKYLACIAKDVTTFGSLGILQSLLQLETELRVCLTRWLSVLA